MFKIRCGRIKADVIGALDSRLSGPVSGLCRTMGESAKAGIALSEKSNIPTPGVSYPLMHAYSRCAENFGSIGT